MTDELEKIRDKYAYICGTSREEDDLLEALQEAFAAGEKFEHDRMERVDARPLVANIKKRAVKAFADEVEQLPHIVEDVGMARIKTIQINWREWKDWLALRRKHEGGKA